VTELLQAVVVDIGFEHWSLFDAFGELPQCGAEAFPKDPSSQT
jgi:hypothetical protein